MTGTNQSPSLAEAASSYLAGLPPEDRGASQQEIYKFIRWFGRESTFNELTAAEIGNYANRLSISDTDYTRKLEFIRKFLAHAKKKGWSKTNLATHLKARKGKTAPRPSSGSNTVGAVSLTQEGYDKLAAELAALQDTRQEVIEEIRKAAADKDFRENAPLHAARERRGQIEGRIMEIEGTLKTAVVIDRKRESDNRVSLGDSVILLDLASGIELRYTLVSSSEVDPAKGKISGASPIGKAVIDKELGETVEIAAPAGKLRYRIKQIER